MSEIKGKKSTKNMPCLTEGCNSATFTIGKLHGELYHHLECSVCGINRCLDTEEFTTVMKKITTRVHNSF